MKTLAAIEAMSGAEYNIVVRTIAAAALSHVLRHIDLENDERPSAGSSRVGRVVHDGGREHHELYHTDV